MHMQPFDGLSVSMFRRTLDLLQQFAGALSDEYNLVVGDAITVQQRALNFFVDGNEISDFLSYGVHVELPEHGTNLHERAQAGNHPGGSDQGLEEGKTDRG